MRYYRTGLFRQSRFRNTPQDVAPIIFPAVRFALLIRPCSPAKVSFTGCDCLSAPSPCERPYRLRVLWADPTPEGSSASLLCLSCPPTCHWDGGGQIHNAPTHDRNPSGAKPGLSEVEEFLTFFSTHATLLVYPGRPSESSPKRSLCIGFWGSLNHRRLHHPRKRGCIKTLS